MDWLNWGGFEPPHSGIEIRQYSSLGQDSNLRISNRAAPALPKYDRYGFRRRQDLEPKTARMAQEQQSSASGVLLGEYNSQ